VAFAFSYVDGWKSLIVAFRMKKGDSGSYEPDFEGVKERSLTAAYS
jgi:hypothetical protein